MAFLHHDFKREPLALLPTPLQRLGRLSRLLGCELYIKRDDLTGLGCGGSKVRKLEYLLADARLRGCSTVLSTGGAQGEHAVLTAACCARLGLECHLVLQGGEPVRRTGNQLLLHMLGAHVTMVGSASPEELYLKLDEAAATLCMQGKEPYAIPPGGSVPLGCLGHVGCAEELAAGAQSLGIEISDVVCAVGSGGMCAGLALGAEQYLPHARVWGVAVGGPPAGMGQLIAGTAQLLQRQTQAAVQLVEAPGQGESGPEAECAVAMRLMAAEEGIILDPVYTGRAFASLLRLAKEGRLGGAAVVFMHTGGLGSTFGVEF